MATPQCPACARLLSRAFVAGLADVQAPCPGCGELLGGTEGAPAVVAATTTSVVEPAAVTVRAGSQDAEPAGEQADEPADEGRDPLEGWDVGVPAPAPLDDPPYGLQPEQAALGAAAGLLVGLLVAGAGRRVRGALLGALLGLLAAAGRVLLGD